MHEYSGHIFIVLKREKTIIQTNILTIIQTKVAKKKRERKLQNLKIEKIAYWWVWISQREDGKKVIIKWWAIPGTVVDCKIIKNKKDHIQAHISNVVSYDNKIKLQDPFCPHFFSPIQWISNETTIQKNKVGCGGCKRQILPYKSQLELKQKIVQEAFSKLSKKWEIQYIIWSPQEKQYRNKIEFSFWPYISHKEEVDERKNLWFHKQWEFSKIIDIDKCFLVSENMQRIFEKIKEICESSGLTYYDNIWHKWFFRHLVIREWTNTNQILVNLSVADWNLTQSEQEIREQTKSKIQTDKFLCENINSFVLTYNNWLADVVRWQDISQQLLFWESFIYEKLVFNQQKEETPSENKTEISFRISPFSFFQTNTLWAEELFQTAFNMIGKIKWNILDLYCGAWTIWLSLKKLWVGENLIWVEIVQEAIIDANHNSKINWLEKESMFFSTPAEEFSTNTETKEFCKNLWLVIVDPPRDGLHKNVIKFISKLREENNFKLLYISCNPITMVRDIELFQEYWFKLWKIQPVDMFPQTHHIETIWILT